MQAARFRFKNDFYGPSLLKVGTKV